MKSGNLIDRYFCPPLRQAIVSEGGGEEGGGFLGCCWVGDEVASDRAGVGFAHGFAAGGAEIDKPIFKNRLRQSLQCLII